MQISKHEQDLLAKVTYIEGLIRSIREELQNKDASPEPVRPSPPQGATDSGDASFPYEKLAGAVNTLATIKGFQFALNVLKAFGVTHAKQLKPDQYHDCYLAVKDASL